jgi:acyl-CoA synthetase (AMP-forming)/AMP-acid ligase II
MYLGAAAAPLNPALRGELDTYLGELRPTLVLREPPPAATTAPPSPAAEPDDVALLLHTSGTTGPSKLVALRQRNLAASAHAIAAWYGLAETDVSACVMPLFHVHGLVASVLAPLAAGGTVLVPRRVAPSRFWMEAADHGATWLSGSPTMLRLLLDGAPAEPLPRLRFVRSCSAPLAPALLHELERRLGVPAVEAYGMTEASHQISSNSIDDRRPGSVGSPAGAEVRLAENGEILVRGPGVIERYAGGDGSPESFADGWLRTGDLGRLDGERLSIVGRLKEVILRGGETISPYEIEHVLLEHEAVEDAACFPVPDETYGEVVGAAVVASRPLGERELVHHCRERLAPFKVPVTIRRVERIPRTASGKIIRRELAG